MKNKLISLIVAGLFICSFFLEILNVVEADQIVTFSNKNLEKVIREKKSGKVVE